MSQDNQIPSTENASVSAGASFEEQFKSLQGQPTESPEVTSEQPSAERPEGLPENFKSVEDMAKAYKELQAKFTKDSQEKAQEAPQESPEEVQEPSPELVEQTAKEQEVLSKAGLDYETLAKEWEENGEYSEASYKAFEDVGIPRSLIDDYVNNKIQSLTLNQEVSSYKTKESDAKVLESVGGQETFDALSSWAQANLSDIELSTYNKIVNNGSHEERMLAVQGLHARYVQSEGATPKLVQGEGTSHRQSSAFTSIEEARKALADPRMSTDPHFRNETMRKFNAMHGMSDTDFFK